MKRLLLFGGLDGCRKSSDLFVSLRVELKANRIKVLVANNIKWARSIHPAVVVKYRAQQRSYSWRVFLLSGHISSPSC